MVWNDMLKMINSTMFDRVACEFFTRPTATIWSVTSSLNITLMWFLFKIKLDSFLSYQ